MINQLKKLTLRRKDAKAIFKTMDFESKPKNGFFVFRFCRPWHLCVFALAVCFGSNLFAQTPVAAPDAKLAQAADQVQKAQDEVQKLKDAWDRTRLESTLYSQRAQRAYKRWAAAKKDWKRKMAQHKDEAQLEFEMAVEKRKLAYDLWQQAQYRLNAQQQLLSAAEETRDIQDTQAHIVKLQSQMAPVAGQVTPVVTPVSVRQ